MAYSEQTGIATVDALIDAIAVFAAANGWTVNRNTLTTTNRVVTIKHASTDYIHIYNTDQRYVNLIGSIDYNGATHPTAQTRASQIASMECRAGPFNKVYLFADTTPSRYIHVVVDSAIAGTCKHMSIGMIDKLEAFTGGTYLDGLFWIAPGLSSDASVYNTANHSLFGADRSQDIGGLRCDFAADSRTDTWFSFGNRSGNDINVQAGISPGALGNVSEMTQTSYLSVNCDDNVFSNRSIGHRIELYVRRLGGYWTEVGSIPNLRLINISKFSLGQEITIGPDTWKMFPMVRPGGGSSTTWVQASGVYGYAYKKT